MKITNALRKQINTAVRANVRGFAPLAEAGTRGERSQPNALLWTEDDDLDDLWRLSGLREINDDPQNPGCAMLDLYVTTGTGNDRELETNVIVLIRDGAVVFATPDGRDVDGAIARLGFPQTRGW